MQCTLLGGFSHLGGAELACSKQCLQHAEATRYAPLQVRLGEKETLDVVQRYFEDRSRKLKQLEYYQVCYIVLCMMSVFDGKSFTNSSCGLPQHAGTETEGPRSTR